VFFCKFAFLRPEISTPFATNFLPPASQPASRPTDILDVVVWRVQANCAEFERRLAAECDALVSAVRRRQHELIENAQREAAYKSRAYADQVTQCTARVHRTTGLLQYSVEIMKERDPTAFLQVNNTVVTVCP